MVEYQDIICPDKALTVPHKPDFRSSDYEVNKTFPDYAGASLPAFVELARQRGYRLVGCNCLGYNSFFVRADLGEESLPEVPVESCFEHPKSKYGMEKRFPRVADMEWTEV